MTLDAPERTSPQSGRAETGAPLGIRIRRHATAGEFLRRAEHWLLRAEAENNLILGRAYRAREAPAPMAHAPYWVTLEHGDAVVGGAFRASPHNLVLTRAPAEALAPLCEHVHRAMRDLPGVSGPTPTAMQFAELWCATSGETWRAERRLRVHALNAVRPPSPVPAGGLRIARSVELAVARQWLKAFIHETGARHASPDMAEQLMRRRQLYFWDDDGPRCMTAVGRETRNGACVSAVYTPPEQRRRGYASAGVAALSQRLLDGGRRFCCLYADAANTTSNSIYRAIGYAPIMEAIDIEFVGRLGLRPRSRADGGAAAADL